MQFLKINLRNITFRACKTNETNENSEKWLPQLIRPRNLAMFKWKMKKKKKTLPSQKIFLLDKMSLQDFHLTRTDCLHET